MVSRSLWVWRVVFCVLVWLHRFIRRVVRGGVVRGGGAWEWFVGVVRGSGSWEWCVGVVRGSGAWEWCVGVMRGSGVVHQVARGSLGGERQRELCFLNIYR
jgi:hypothetical protein